MSWISANMGVKGRVEEISDKIGDVVTNRSTTEPLLDKIAKRLKEVSLPKRQKKETKASHVMDLETPIKPGDANIKRVIGVAIIFLFLIAILSVVLYGIITVLTLLFDNLGLLTGFVIACVFVAILIGVIALYFATTHKEDRKEEDEIVKRWSYEKD
jgi:uncharacterized membrane protein